MSNWKKYFGGFMVKGHSVSPPYVTGDWHASKSEKGGWPYGWCSMGGWSGKRGSTPPF